MATVCATQTTQRRRQSMAPVNDAPIEMSNMTPCQIAAAARDGNCLNPNPPSLPDWMIKGRRGWRRIVQNFIPSWFAVTMGTGIVSILLYTLSTMYTRFETPLRILSIVWFFANIVLFTTFLVISVLRHVLYPATWTLMIQHPVQSLFLGTIPMGFATIVNMFTLVCVPYLGGASAQIAWAMWWIDVVASVACCFGLPFQMMTKHQTKHETMTAAWLLPVVAPIVAAASGAVVASVLPDPQHALWTIITSYVLWGTGVPLAFVVIVIYFHRLAVYKLPPQEVIVSVFLPLGPMGQGSYGLMALGKEAMRVFPLTNTLHPMAGDFLFVMGFAAGLVMWGFGLVWLFFATASISRSKFPFNMGWWGFTFPLGVFAMSTLHIGEILPSEFFRGLGTTFAVCVFLLWVLVASGTIRNVIYGNLFAAPCLKEVEKLSKPPQNQGA
ncbi:C4-dicarboxylate transporter/malic acid transport protein-like protein [Aaosphaeria arxii CBS 175.79]|uniref:Sulfite efflux pump SSU1 n=1 Tax=Aaosphaeria arxii CBS 175.79 TaxID=1450172 RepID=A0A6A5XEU9_9PLEO|nr:C4-dicarboxylate transporter/malic acid transport protein-like protein [Aaosphaeria arxii CBS 175.79]KAF2011443.1 C4-dicarboxylate transporter/malic acid transport protein-like protein [Aaosphaeria arxii CBS 175.79]